VHILNGGLQDLTCDFVGLFHLNVGGNDDDDDDDDNDDNNNPLLIIFLLLLYYTLDSSKWEYSLPVCTNITTTIADKQEHNQQKFTALYCSCFFPLIMMIHKSAAAVTRVTNHKASPWCFFLYSFYFRIKMFSSIILVAVLRHIILEISPCFV